MNVVYKAYTYDDKTALKVVKIVDGYIVEIWEQFLLDDVCLREEITDKLPEKILHGHGYRKLTGRKLESVLKQRASSLLVNATFKGE